MILHRKSKETSGSSRKHINSRDFVAHFDVHVWYYIHVIPGPETSIYPIEDLGLVQRSRSKNIRKDFLKTTEAKENPHGEPKLFGQVVGVGKLAQPLFPVREFDKAEIAQKDRLARLEMHSAWGC